MMTLWIAWQTGGQHFCIGLGGALLSTTTTAKTIARQFTKAAPLSVARPKKCLKFHPKQADKIPSTPSFSSFDTLWDAACSCSGDSDGSLVTISTLMSSSSERRSAPMASKFPSPGRQKICVLVGTKPAIHPSQRRPKARNMCKFQTKYQWDIIGNKFHVFLPAKDWACPPTRLVSGVSMSSDCCWATISDCCLVVVVFRLVSGVVICCFKLLFSVDRLWTCCASCPYCSVTCLYCCETYENRITQICL